MARLEEEAATADAEPLLAAGWLRQAARGRYEVPADRVVPLLVVLSATTG